VRGSRGAPGGDRRTDRDALIGLFDESAVLIGSSGDGRDRQGGRRLTSGEMRAPIRVTVLAVETPDGWRLRQFHGSIPYGG
jgi:hypothetical protein